MFRRRRPLARAAVIGGGAYVMGKRAAQGEAREQEQDAQIEQLESEQTAPAPAPTGGLSDAAIQQLEQLGKLKQEGILTVEEFDEQKKKVLQSM